MCEEVKNPSITVPQSIMFSVVINGLMGFAMIISYLYAITDIEKAVNSDTGYPFIEIFYQATNSVAGTAAMAALIIFMTFSAVVGVIAATSRMFWAFARDRGLPFWGTLSKVGFQDFHFLVQGVAINKDYRLTLAPQSQSTPSPSQVSFHVFWDS